VTPRSASDTDDWARRPKEYALTKRKVDLLKTLAEAGEASDNKKLDLSNALARAREASDKLGEVTDAMNAVIAEAEKAIADLRLGVPGYAQMYVPDDPAMPPWEKVLAFQKDGKQWRLMIGSGPEGDIDSWTPLTNASRDSRLEAVDLLPKVVQDMLERAEKEVTEVEDKTEQALKFIESLKPPRAS
jgi:hypothetical protein